MNSARIYFIYLFCSLLGGEVMLGMDINKEIQATYQKINESKNEEDRVFQMKNLIETLSKIDKDKMSLVDDESVDSVAMLLEINGDVGRFYGAKALSVIACRAGRSLPSLRKALQQAGPIQSDFEPLVLAPAVSPRAEIEAAITKIEHTQPCA